MAVKLSIVRYAVFVEFQVDVLSGGHDTLRRHNWSTIALVDSAMAEVAHAR